MLSALSQAWASWKTAPGIALLAILAFAVGIGSTTAIFTVINSVMLRPLPYPDGERFVVLFGARTNEPNNSTALELPEVQALAQQTTSFDAIGWFLTGRFNLTAPGEPAFVSGTAVTRALAGQLGPPMLGQWFADENGAVISSPLWRRLGGRRDIIGSSITLDDRRYLVTGVMPPAFRFPIVGTAMTREDTDVWIALDPTGRAGAAGNGLYVAYARRKPGVPVSQAQADVARVATNFAATDPVRYARHTATVNGLHEPIRKNLRFTLLALFAGAGLLLVIACANVATLLLARSVVRARETAIRVALGASRRQLALGYFAEGGLVSVAGAAAGVALSAIFTRQILSAASEFVPHPDEISIDWKVLGFSVVVALATGVLAGLAPLWQAFRTAPNTVLTEGVRASASASARRLSKLFVVGEIALAFTLLTASTILIVHLRNLDRVALGFEPDRLLTFDLVVPRRILGTEARWPEQQRLMAALQQTPGVMSATFANQLAPYPGCIVGNVFVDGRPPGPDQRSMCLTLTTADFFAVMRIPLRAGRLWTAADTEADLPQPLVAMISETAARTYWPGRNPIGASGRLGGPNGLLFEVVGVVGDVYNNGANKPPDPEFYLSAKNRFLAFNPMSVIVRSDLPVDQLLGAVRRGIRQTDPTLVMEDVSTMNDVVHDALQLERVSSLVMTFFGMVALLMATLGIYSVVSYFVRQRTMELGTRMALGAVNRDLVALVLGGGLKLSLAGLAVGSVALVGGVRLLVRVLEVADIGWLPFASSAAVVAFVSGAAASVPAWRTTLISPMAAMREQPPSAWRWIRLRVARAARNVREAVVGTDDSESAISPAGVLTAFVDAARGAESYSDALRAVLTSVCDELHVESAALLERRDASQPDYTCLTAVGTIDAATPVVPADGFLISRMRVHLQPLPLAADELAALAGWAAEHRPERLDEIRALAAAGVRLAVPLRTRHEILGVLLLGERAPRAGFSTQEKQALRAGADQFALMIENARLTDRVVEQETLRRDIALASDVQRRLLPDAPAVAEFADFAAISVPARRIGGDYYDFLGLPDRAIGIALADVSGKGVAAALIMSVVQASLRIISSEGDVPLPSLVARMNEFVYRSTPSSKYATFFYARLDRQCRQLRYVNAGHNPPYLVRAGRTSGSGSALPVIEELSVGGTVVGMFPEMSYEEGSVELYPGDVLLAYTDGVPEAHSPDNEEFGEGRLQQLLCAAAHLPADEISARISSQMKNWIRDAEQYDDLTFIVMKVR